MLETFFSIYKGFFSRAFWFGSFLPVAIFAAIHAGLAWAVFPAHVRLGDWLSADTGTAAKGLSIALAALVVLAYAITPLLPMFRAILDGTLLPPWMQDRLRQERVAEAAPLQRPQSRQALDESAQTSEFWETLKADFIDKQPALWAAGRRLPLPADDGLIQAAERLVRPLTAYALLARLPDRATVQAAIAAEYDMLRAGLTSNGSDAQTALLARVDDAARDILGVLRDACKEARIRLDNVKARTADSPLDHFRATRIGDVRDRIESYPKRVYNVEFEYLWPRLQTAFGKDDALIDAMNDAKSQVDFALLSLALSITVPLVWLPLLAATATLPWSFLGIAFVSPLLMGFFNELTVQSQAGFGTMVETTVDKYRLTVLTHLLQQPMPTSLAAERAAWARVRNAADPNTGVNVTYWPA